MFKVIVILFFILLIPFLLGKFFFNIFQHYIPNRETFLSSMNHTSEYDKCRMMGGTEMFCLSTYWSLTGQYPKEERVSWLDTPCVTDNGEPGKFLQGFREECVPYAPAVLKNYLLLRD